MSADTPEKEKMPFELPMKTPERFIQGFTLIDLMIVVAIIGILTAVAFPSYRNSVIRSNRSAAQGYMMDITTRQEQYLLDTRQYFAGTALVPPPADVAANYAITVVANNAATPPTCLITATAIGGQASDGALTLDCAGNKTPAAKWE